MSNVEDTNNSSDLSEFFSALSKEKKETRQKLKEQIANPESGLSNLFQQLEEVHRETQKVSEETSDNKSLSPDDQNKLEAFSSLMNSVDVSLQEVQEETPEGIETVKPVVAEVFNDNSDIGTAGIYELYTRISFVCYLREKLVNCPDDIDPRFLTKSGHSKIKDE